jgi:hypothetical protein
LFIDTSHTVEQTLGELRTYVPRIRPGGVALFHDTEWREPSEMLDEPGGWVKEALDIYCAEAGLEWENRSGSYGMGIIRR